MNKEEAYQVAVDMFQREHRRWVENALFLFGGLGSVFYVAQTFSGLLPKQLTVGLGGILISIVITCIAVSIRVSTDAWRETVVQIEAGSNSTDDYQPFRIWQRRQASLSYWNDIRETILPREPRHFFSVTRSYVRLAVLLTLYFAAVLVRAVFDRPAIAGCWLATAFAVGFAVALLAPMVFRTLQKVFCAKG